MADLAGPVEQDMAVGVDADPVNRFQGRPGDVRGSGIGVGSIELHRAAAADGDRGPVTGRNRRAADARRAVIGDRIPEGDGVARAGEQRNRRARHHEQVAAGRLARVTARAVVARPAEDGIVLVDGVSADDQRTAVGHEQGAAEAGAAAAVAKAAAKAPSAPRTVSVGDAARRRRAG